MYMWMETYQRIVNIIRRLRHQQYLPALIIFQPPQPQSLPRFFLPPSLILKYIRGSYIASVCIITHPRPSVPLSSPPDHSPPHTHTHTYQAHVPTPYPPIYPDPFLTYNYRAVLYTHVRTDTVMEEDGEVHIARI